MLKAYSFGIRFKFSLATEENDILYNIKEEL